jgi:DNA-directed RNA polymerase subunit RPC12/RpoP
MNTSDAIRLTCEHCGQSFRVKSIAAGRSAKCPGCSKPVAVPSQPLVASATPTQVETPAFTAGKPASNLPQPESLFDDLSPLDLANALNAKAREIPDSPSPYNVTKNPSIDLFAASLSRAADRSLRTAGIGLFHASDLSHSGRDRACPGRIKFDGPNKRKRTRNPRHGNG